MFFEMIKLHIRVHRVGRIHGFRIDTIVFCGC